jgi:hypothetical protein
VKAFTDGDFGYFVRRVSFQVFARGQLLVYFPELNLAQLLLHLFTVWCPSAAVCHDIPPP